MKENKKKGFTLIELVIVIAIMSIVLVTIGLSINVVFSNKSKSASKEIYSMLGTSQNLGMSKENVYFFIKRDSKGEYTTGVARVTGGTVNVAQSVNISNKVTIELNGTTLANGTGYMIGINRSTGGFSQTYVYGTTTVASNINTITVKGSGKDYKIQLSYTNGKFFMVD
jgi:prepilin-type N-terminal cleavage/methylation domain-containing protein